MRFIRDSKPGSLWAIYLQLIMARPTLWRKRLMYTYCKINKWTERNESLHFFSFINNSWSAVHNEKSNESVYGNGNVKLDFLWNKWSKKSAPYFFNDISWVSFSKVLKEPYDTSFKMGQYLIETLFLYVFVL